MNFEIDVFYTLTFFLNFKTSLVITPPLLHTHTHTHTDTHYTHTRTHTHTHTHGRHHDALRKTH